MMNMPDVKNCSVQECFYNQSELCHAPAINVGSGHPVCDTFIYRQDQHGLPSDNALVGACHMSDCKYNGELSCHAPSINVDYHMSHPDCYTYSPRPNVEEDVDVQLSEENPMIESTGSRSARLGPPEA